MLNLIRKVFPARPVAGAALDDLVRIGHGDVVPGIGIREHPAFIDQVVMPLGAPPLHPVAPPGMVFREFHQTEIWKVVRIHIDQSNLQSATPLVRPEDVRPTSV